MGRRSQICIEFRNLDNTCKTALLEYIKQAKVNIDINSIKIIGYKPIERRLKKIESAIQRIDVVCSNYRHFANWNIDSEISLCKHLRISRATFRRWRELGVLGSDLILPANKGGLSITAISWADLRVRMKKYLNSIQ